MPGWQASVPVGQSQDEGWGGSEGWAPHGSGDGFVNGGTAPKASESDDDDDIPIGVGVIVNTTLSNSLKCVYSIRSTL